MIWSMTASVSGGPLTTTEFVRVSAEAITVISAAEPVVWPPWPPIMPMPPGPPPELNLLVCCELDRDRLEEDEVRLCPKTSLMSWDVLEASAYSRWKTFTSATLDSGESSFLTTSSTTVRTDSGPVTTTVFVRLSAAAVTPTMLALASPCVPPGPPGPPGPPNGPWKIMGLGPP